VKIRDEGLVRNKAVYVALALDAEGHKHVLGLWIEQTEGAKFWLKVMNDLKTRGLGDILIAVADGLKGFPEAIGAVFPETMVQTCIIHLIRNSLAFVSWKDRKQIMPDLKAIYCAESADAALDRLAEFEDKWDARYPAIGQSWRRSWEHVIPLFAVPPDIRKMIYTTNAVESLNQGRGPGRAAARNGQGSPEHRPARRSWSSGRLANGQWPEPTRFTHLGGELPESHHIQHTPVPDLMLSSPSRIARSALSLCQTRMSPRQARTGESHVPQKLLVCHGLEQ